MMDAPRFRALGVAFVAAAVAALIVSAGAGATPNKPYSTVICGGGQTGCTSQPPPGNPAVIGPGGTATDPSALTVTFTNDNKLGSGIELGSDNLNVPATPAGFGVLSASLPPTSPTQQPTPVNQCPASFNNSAPLCVVFSNGDATTGFGTIGFRNLNLQPGQSITIDLTVVTPSPSTTLCITTNPCTWSDQAKQSNDFSGTGNGLNSDSNSSYGTVTSAVASCAKRKGCSTTLGDGGAAADTPTGSPGSVNVIITTSSGKTAVTQTQELDFGPPPSPSLCSGVSSAHYTTWDMSNGADNGSDRSQTISITTTPGFPGFVQEICFVSEKQFTMKTLVNGSFVAAPANSTTFSDGTPAFQGLLPDCTTNPSAMSPTVDCNKLPGVLERLQNSDGTTTTIAAIPPGFDHAIAGN